MTLHWIHVAVSWAGTLVVFGAMGLLSVARQRQAVARLRRLDPRREPGGEKDR